MRHKFALSIAFLLLAILLFTLALPPKPVAGDEPLPPDVVPTSLSGKGFIRPVSFPVPVDGGEIFYHADGCITVRHKGKILADHIECVDPDSLPQREMWVSVVDRRTSETCSGGTLLAAGLGKPYEVSLWNGYTNYGVSATLRPGPLSTGDGRLNSAVTSVFVWGDPCGGGAGRWYVELGFAYNPGCTCWGIFYSTNYWPDGNPDSWYQVFLGPANETDWHTFKAYRDGIDINGYNVWVDGHVFTKLPLPGGNPSPKLTIGTHHNETNRDFIWAKAQYVYRYQLPNAGSPVRAKCHVAYCIHPPGQQYYAGVWYADGYFVLYGPTWGPGCLYH
jgi:hypothetical protein